MRRLLPASPPAVSLRTPRRRIAAPFLSVVNAAKALPRPPLSRPPLRMQPVVTFPLPIAIPIMTDPASPSRQPAAN